MTQGKRESLSSGGESFPSRDAIRGITRWTSMDNSEYRIHYKLGGQPTIVKQLSILCIWIDGRNSGRIDARYQSEKCSGAF